MSNKILPTAFLLCIFSVSFAQPRKVVADKIVAVVGNKIILKSDIDNSIIDMQRQGVAVPDGVSERELAAYLDLHVGTVGQVLATLSDDPILGRASDIVFQPHPVDPPHEVVLRSLELIAEHVAPAIGWVAQKGTP